MLRQNMNDINRQNRNDITRQNMKTKYDYDTKQIMNTSQNIKRNHEYKPKYK